MATLANPASRSTSLRSAFHAIADFFADIGRAGHAASRYQNFAALNDSELEAIGRSRQDSGRAAYETTFGKL